VHKEEREQFSTTHAGNDLTKIMRKMLITGGAGFIGSNAARHFARRDWEVWIFDNCERCGTALNLDLLRRDVPVTFIRGDVRKPGDLASVFTRAGGFDAVLHLAAQVAVTTSVTDPMNDFEVNAAGTLHVLEAIRRHSPGATLVYASTNKVYGGLSDVAVVLRGDRYEFETATQGISEKQPLDFHSPYGCSKGAADQYVADYARIYGLRTFVIRQSCIYGPWQYGIEDQGWVAWFAIAAFLHRPITIFGDGHQNRDLLWVEDLIELYDRAIASSRSSGIYNAGGGPDRCASVLQVLTLLKRALNREILYSFDNWRPGDQKVFVSANNRAAADLGWRPQTGVEGGVAKLVGWIEEHEHVLQRCFEPPVLQVLARSGTA
jgi:CDP-paratose 2-epimerase